MASKFWGKSRRYLLTGVLTIVPITITIILFQIVLNLIASAGRPITGMLGNAIRPFSERCADFMVSPFVEYVLSIVIVFAIIYILGWFATRVLGRQLIALFEGMVEKIPLVQTIYGSSKRMLNALTEQPQGVKRVVLIDFPSREMKCVGFVTRTLTDEATGRKLAAVYVPTTPNPTSGYLEIVPVERIISTDWTIDEAMAFVVSGGSVAPERINYGEDRGLEG